MTLQWIPGFDQKLQEMKVEQKLQELREAAGKKEPEEDPWKQQVDKAEQNSIIDDQIEAKERNLVEISRRQFWAKIVYNFALTSLGSAVSIIAPHFVHLQ